jgi:hypothetical protein
LSEILEMPRSKKRSKVEQSNHWDGANSRLPTHVGLLPLIPLAITIAILASYWSVHALVVFTSILGASPLRDPWLARAILALGALAVGAVMERVMVNKPVGSAGEPPVESFGWSYRAVLGTLTLFGAVALTAIAAAAAWSPITSYDALGYRLPTIAQWLDAGRITWVVSDDPVRNGYPMGLEAIGAVVAAAFGSVTLVDLLSIPLMAAGAAGVWLVASVAGVRAPLGRAAAAVFVLAPIGLLNGPSGYVDAAFAGALVSLLALMAVATEPRCRFGQVAAAGAGMAAALVMALKGTGIAFVGAVALLGGGRAYLVKSSSVSKILLFILFNLPGAFWMARNVVYTGNPLWPVDLSVAGIHLFQGVGSVDAIMDAAHNTPPELRRHCGVVQVALTWLQVSGPATGFDERLAGLGYAWPLLALPAITWFIARAIADRTLLWSPAFFLFLTTGICFVLQPMPWWSRYTLWLWGAGALALALAGETLAAGGRRRSLGLGLVLLAVLCVGEGGFSLYHVGGLGPSFRAGARASLFANGFHDLRKATVTRAGLDPRFWALGLDQRHYICRGSWKPGTDNANLDGVFAQLLPRPRVFIIADDRVDWPTVKRQWLRTPCPELLLMSTSPVVVHAQQDRSVSVVRATAFDPLFVVYPRK